MSGWGGGEVEVGGGEVEVGGGVRTHEIQE